MEIRCRCSACQAKLRIAEKHAGKTVRCPRCKAPVEVPALDAAETGREASTAPQVAAPHAAGSEVVAPPPAIPGGPPLSPAASPAEPPPPPIVAPLGAEPDDSFPAIDVHAARGALRGGKPGAGNSRAVGPRGRQASSLPLVVAGGMLLLIGGVLIGMFLSADSPQPDAKAVGSASGPGTLVLAWPENEREGAALLIDGRHAGIASTGELRYDLRAGSHAILIERRGYEPFVKRVVLRSGATEQISPTWKVAANAPIATAAGASSAADSLGGETATASPAVRGFEGWLTSYSAARKQAAADKKELAIVFGCSDAQPTTQELARALQEPSANNALANTVRVVIDIPRAPTNRDQAAENRRLMQEFGLTRLPALVLADEQGRPYALEKRWEYGFERLTDKLDAWQKQRIDRDRLLAAAEKGSEADRIGNASVTVEWLQEQDVWMFYRPEIRKWYELAERLDPKNEQHLLEALFEPQWLGRVGETNANDAADVLRVAEELQPWISRKFDDADRGARLHMAAARLLTDARKFDEAALHMEQAIKYQPRDARLADAVRHVRQLLDNKDVLGSGTGFLVSAGYVVTNQHVVDGPGQVAIRIPGEKETIAAELVAQDMAGDLALLKASTPIPPRFRPMPLWADSVRRGSAVAAFGFPLGDTLGDNLKFTSGAVSALPDDANNGMYLLDVRINPGNSGGPLCDQRGNVVGMISAKTDSVGASDSYGLAIPSPAITRFLDQHLPPAASRPLADTSPSPLTWELVDERVSSGVLKVVKKKP